MLRNWSRAESSELTLCSSLAMPFSASSSLFAHRNVRCSFMPSHTSSPFDPEFCEFDSRPFLSGLAAGIQTGLSENNAHCFNVIGVILKAGSTVLTLVLAAPHDPSHSIFYIHLLLKSASLACAHDAPSVVNNKILQKCCGTSSPEAPCLK